MKTRNKILVIVAVFITVFIVYTVAFYSIKGWQFDGLFPYLLGIGGVVDAMTAWVAVTDKKNRKED